MQRIAESELIINSRGAVYHLNLRPEELATTVITVGDPDRVALVSRYFDSIEGKYRHREFVSHTGFIGKKKSYRYCNGHRSGQYRYCAQ